MTKTEIQLLLLMDKGKPVILQPDTTKKFFKAGLIDMAGDLTGEGISKVDGVKEMLRQLKKGVVAASRVSRYPNAIVDDGGGPWFTGTVAKKHVFTDRNMLVMGKPPKGLTSERGSSTLRSNMSRPFSLVTRVEHFPVELLLFMTEGTLEGCQFYVFVDKERSVEAAMQVKYYDYLEKRFPSGQWWFSPEISTFSLWVPKQGVTRHNIVALVAELKDYDVDGAE